MIEDGDELFPKCLVSILEGNTEGLIRTLNSANSSDELLQRLMDFYPMTTDMLEALLMYGVDANVIEKDHKLSLLARSIIRDYPDGVVDLLIRHKATFNSIDFMGLATVGGADMHTFCKNLVHERKDGDTKQVLLKMLESQNER